MILCRPPPNINWDIQQMYGRKVLGDLVEWLSTQNPAARIHTLYYDGNKPEEKEVVRDLIQHSGPSIKNLRVVFPMFSDNDEAKDILRDFVDLNTCPNLQSLFLGGITLWPKDLKTPLICTWVLRLFSQISGVSASGSLQQVTLELNLQYAHEYETALNVLKWDDMAETFSKGESFSGLRSVRLIVDAPINIDACKVAKGLKERMGVWGKMVVVDFPALDRRF